MISTQVDWTRKDFRSFLNAMERRGRDEVDVIARETSNETGKTEEEARRGVLELPRHRRDGYTYTHIYMIYIYIYIICHAGPALPHRLLGAPQGARGLGASDR